MPSDLLLKTMNTVHRSLLSVTRGSFGWSISEMPVLELTTIGRTSGRPRSVLLTAPWIDGESLVVIGSAGGNDHHPAWFVNLRANPAVQVRTENSTSKMTARIVTGDERERIWADVITQHDNYATYQSKTTREIPVVMLEPASASESANQ